MRKLSTPMATYLLHIVRHGHADGDANLQTVKAADARGYVALDWPVGTKAVQLTAAGWSALVASHPAVLGALLDELHTKAEDMASRANATLAQHPEAVCRVPAGTAATLTHIRNEHNWTGHQGRRSALLNTTWVGEHADGAPYVTDAGYVAMGWPVSPDLIITPGGPTRVRKPGTTEPRSEVRVTPPGLPGNGTSRTWSRVLSGKRYSFCAILMPDGERRYSVQRFDGAPGSEGFGCDWTHLHFITVPAPVAAAETEPTCPACGLPKTYGLANLIDGLLVCDDCASNARQISDTSRNAVPTSAVGPITAHLTSPVPAFTDDPSDAVIDMLRAEPFGSAFNRAVSESVRGHWAPKANLRPYTAPKRGDAVYDKASGQHGTVHRVVSPDTVRVRWDGKHGRHLVAVSALTFVASAEALDLWNGAEQTQSFMDQIRAEIRNTSSDDAETFRPTGGCA